MQGNRCHVPDRSYGNPVIGSSLTIISQWMPQCGSRQISSPVFPMTLRIFASAALPA
jgi:hypothetical protein